MGSFSGRYCTHNDVAVKALDKNHFCVYNFGMVRPKKSLAEVASERIDLRVTKAERSGYGRAAERAGQSLSEWIRGCLSRAARRGAGKP